MNAGAGENPFATWTLDVPTQSWTLVDGNVKDGGSAAMCVPGKIFEDRHLRKDRHGHGGNGADGLRH